MNKLKMMILLLVISAGAVFGQATSGEKEATKWPEWKDKAGVIPEEKPSAMGARPAVKRESGNVPRRTAAEAPKPKDLFQVLLDRALELRRQWADLHRQIPRQIPRTLDAAGYAAMINLIEKTQVAKHRELEAWKQYHEAHRSYWSKRLDEEDVSNETIQSEIQRIQSLLEQEEAAHEDLEQRLNDIDQTTGNAVDSDNKIRGNLLAIRDQHMDRIQELRRALSELAATLGNKKKMRIIAESNIALVQNNLKTNLIEGSYWEAVYGSARSVVRLLQDEVTPAPFKQPKGEQL
jgi:hypothetical protein